MKRRLALGSIVALVLGSAAGPGAVFAQTDTPNKVIDFETIIGGLDADGSIRNLKLIDYLVVTGTGDVLVVDPVAINDFRTLSGFSGPDLGEGTATWRIEGLAGSREFITESTPDVAPPIAMQVRYFLEGEEIAGPALVGADGSVALEFTVSNTTSEPREITFADAAGTETTITEMVPIPLVATLQLHLPRGRFSGIEVQGADVVADHQGNLIVQWNMVLVPPIGDLTQTFRLSAQARDFRLGPIRLAGAPVAPQSRPFLSFTEGVFGGNVTSASGLYSGALQLGSSLDELHAGTLELLDGLEQLFAGSQELTAGLEEAATGSGELAGGLNEAAEGSGQLTDGLLQLRDGSRQLTDGLEDAFDGSSRITAGLGQLQEGLGKILAGLNLMASSLPSAQAAAFSLSQGASAIEISLAQMRTGLQGIQGQVAALSPQLAAAMTPIINGIGAPEQPGTIRAGIAQIQGGLTSLAAGIGQAVAGLGSASNQNTLIGGMTAALQGVRQLHDGSRRLTGGLKEAAGGSGQISDGLVEAHGGSVQLTDGLGLARAGSEELAAGLQKAADGSGQITDGLGQARGGAGQIEQGVYAITELGVKEIARGANQSAAELSRTLALLRAQDERAETEALLYGPPSSEQADAVVGGSAVILTLDALDGRSSASVFRVILAAGGLVLLVGLGLMGMRMRAA